jgi:hypothetical protein
MLKRQAAENAHGTRGVDRLLIVTIASMTLAARLASAQGRSPRSWIWIAAVTGPFALLALSWLKRQNGTT